MLLVQLTEMPAPVQKDEVVDYKPRLEIKEHLCDYKEAFLHEKVIQSLMNHLADCLKEEEKNTKHN